MRAPRAISAGLMALGLVLSASGLRAQTIDNSCEDWAADAGAKAPVPVTLIEFKYLDVSAPLEVTQVQGLVRKGSAKMVRIELDKSDPEAESGLAMVAIERDDSGRKAGTTVRLSVTAEVIDADTGKKLGWTKVLLKRDSRLTDLPAGFYEPLDCFEVPGEATLVPLATIVKDDGIDLTPSLGDIGKDEDGPLGSVLGPNPSLAEIGKGEAKPEVPKRSLGELGTKETADVEVEEKAPPVVEPTEPVVEETEDPAPAPPPLPTAEAAMCDMYGIALPAAEGFTPMALQIAGQRSAASEAPLWTYSSIVDLATASDRLAALSTPPGVIEPLEVVRSFRIADAPVQHLVRPLLPDGLRLAGEPEPEAVPTFLTVRVFGDARMVGLSGLAALDETTTDVLPAGGLTIIWHEIQPDGTIGTEREFARFGDLITSARNLPVTDVSYSSRSTMQSFANGLADVLVGAEATTDVAVWVLEGVLLPDETPAILSEMIAKVGRDGNIRRFVPGDGRPRRWLHVVAGQFAQTFSESYIRGPVLRADPPIGEVDVERDSSLEERTLLEDGGKLALALENHIRRNAGADGIPDVDPSAELTDTYIDGFDAYDNIGILLPTDQLPDWLDAASQSMLAIKRYTTDAAAEMTATDLDLSALILLKSNAEGRAAGLDPVESEGNLQQRLARLEAIGLLDDYDSLLNQLTSQLVIARAVSADACGHIFIDLGN